MNLNLFEIFILVYQMLSSTKEKRQNNWFQDTYAI